MKNIFPILVLTGFIFLSEGCSHHSRPTDASSGEVVIAGCIRNRQVYPQTHSILLQLPFFSQAAIQYTAPINQDSTFHFRFPLHADMAEASIVNYAEQLYVKPGDSLYVEIDFKDMLHPVVTGTGETLNRQMLLFVNGGYYRQQYAIDPQQEPEAFETALRTAYNNRKQRLQDFWSEQQPTEEVKQLTNTLITLDAYTALFAYAATYQEERHTDKRGYQQTELKRAIRKVEKYNRLLPHLDSLFLDNNILSSRFRLAKELNLYIQKNILAETGQQKEVENRLQKLSATKVLPYALSEIMTSRLAVNDTTAFRPYHSLLDSIARVPYLHENVMNLYRSKVAYLKCPTTVSNNLLYGNSGNDKKTEQMEFMKPLYQLMEQHKGKVIYIEFWGTYCGPCIEEMIPMKELRKKFSPSDVTIISYCGNGSRDDYDRLMEQFRMKETGIICLFGEEWTSRKNYLAICKQLGIQGTPSFLLFNREGMLVNFGSLIRPSYPDTERSIRQWLESK